MHDDIERVAIADLVWSVSKKETFEMWVNVVIRSLTNCDILRMYHAISPQCNTSFITRSTAQSNAIAAEVRKKFHYFIEATVHSCLYRTQVRALGYDARAYTA